MGSSRTLRGGMSPAGELQSSSHNANLIAPYASEKNCVRTSNNPYGLYDVRKSKIKTITRFNLLRFAVQVRTSTDRTGCTNFFREKCTFYGQGWTSGSMPTKPRTLRPPGRAMLCTAPEYPKVGTLVFFASCLNIRKILQERRKSGRTATEKEKSPYWLQICNSKGRGETVY